MGAEHNAKDGVVQGEVAAVLIRLPREQKEALVAASARDHRTLNGTLRVLIDDYLAGHSDDPDLQPAA